MSAELERGLRVIELLASARGGASFTSISESLSIPKSATHRLLTNLLECGYLHLDPHSQRYSLTLKPASIALQHLSLVPMVDLARPYLDQLAQASGELVRLSLLEDGRLVRVAKAQGSVAGLRYDPDHGGIVKLSCAASGYAWLANHTDEEAARVLTEDGFAGPDEFGPNAPSGLAEALKIVRRTRRSGFCYLTNSYEAGISSLGVAIKGSDGNVSGVLTIAGPTFRFSSAAATQVLPLLHDAAAALGSLHSFGVPSQADPSA